MEKHSADYWIGALSTHLHSVLAELDDERDEFVGPIAEAAVDALRRFYAEYPNLDPGRSTDRP